MAIAPKRIRLGGIHLILDAAAPDGHMWLAGKRVHDHSGTMDAILSAAAPDGDYYLSGRRVARKHFFTQLIAASSAGVIMSGLSIPIALSNGAKTLVVLCVSGGTIGVGFVLGWLVTKAVLDQCKDRNGNRPHWATLQPPQDTLNEYSDPADVLAYARELELTYLKEDERRVVPG